MTNTNSTFDTERAIAEIRALHDRRDELRRQLLSGDLPLAERDSLTLEQDADDAGKVLLAAQIAREQQPTSRPANVEVLDAAATMLHAIMKNAGIYRSDDPRRMVLEWTAEVIRSGLTCEQITTLLKEELANT